MVYYTLFELDGEGTLGSGLTQMEAFQRLMSLTETAHKFGRESNGRPTLTLNPGDPFAVTFHTNTPHEMLGHEHLIRQVLDYGWQRLCIVPDATFLESGLAGAKEYAKVKMREMGPRMNQMHANLWRRT